MLSLKTDWSLDVPPKYYTLEDYQGGEARWCTGCGDHGVLTAVQRICRDEQLAPEKTVCVSGIGCSSRFPHYMKTYGFHGLHGRALPVACGVKARRPDLHVWVATGDGDCCSIGAGHWVHAVRYNMDMVVMLFDNNIYGLTKMQSSPTTPMGFKTNTHPRGVVIPALNPASTTLAFANVSFVARTMDWNPVHLHATLHKAFKHRGLSFVHIMQRCPHFTPGMYDGLQHDPSNLLLLEHENGVQIDPNVAKIFPNRVAHDPSDIGQAHALSHHETLVAIGLLFHDPNRAVYDDFVQQGIGSTATEKLEGLNRAFDEFAIS